MKNKTKSILLIIIGILALYLIVKHEDNNYKTYAEENGCTWHYINGLDVCK